MKRVLEIGVGILKKHFFDSKKGFVEKYDKFGNPIGFDTFNHQLWFASIASYYKEYDVEIDSMINRFVNRIEDNIVVRKMEELGNLFISIILNLF